MRNFKFKGVKIEYDDKYIKSYSFSKALACGIEDEARFYKALERLYNGRDEEYADAVAEAMPDVENAMLELVKATYENAGKQAKNSGTSQPLSENTQMSCEQTSNDITD